MLFYSYCLSGGRCGRRQAILWPSSLFHIYICFCCLQEPEAELQKTLRDELEARLAQLQNRVTTLRTESEEVWKTLETAETTLLKMLNAKDFYCSGYFGEGAIPVQKPPETVSIKLRADRQETEEFYLTVSWLSPDDSVLKIETSLQTNMCYIFPLSCTEI